MQLISKSVGEGGVNDRSDVALVQAILVKTQRSAIRVPMIVPTLAPYLANYDGVCGGATKDAIRAFQSDNGLTKDNQPAPGSAPAWGFQLSLLAPGVKPGLVEPNDATWQKLLEKVPPDFADLRVLAGGKTVYVAATANQVQQRIAAAGALTFQPAFLQKVVICLNGVYELYGIAVGVCPQGDRRDFGTQDIILNKADGSTHAGPGESNHNFGMAVDLGFKGLRWLRPTGEVVENEDPWMHKLSPGGNPNAESLRFWQAMRTVGTSPRVGLFRGPEADRPHLQNWDDAGVSMGARLADLLARSGSMRWSAHYVDHYHYKSDLGLGGDLVELGTADEIWNKQATFTLDVLKKARAAAKAPKGAPPSPPVTDADVTAMKLLLRGQFELADANWPSWTAK